MELKDRSDFTSHALSLIQGDRAKDYGDALENHKKIAETWTDIIGYGALGGEISQNETK